MPKTRFAQRRRYKKLNREKWKARKDTKEIESFDGRTYSRGYGDGKSVHAAI